MHASPRPWTLLCALAQLSACAGSGDGLDANGRPLDPGGSDQGALTPDLASLQANVFTPICTACHVGAGAPQGLRLDAASSYGALVGVPSAEAPATLRVKPGDPGASYLLQKLEGRASVGARMPLGQPALPDATIQVIRQWILDGAAPARKAGAALNVETLSAAATTVSIAFSRPLDATRVDAESVVLEGSDARGGARLAVPRRVRVSPDNDALILVVPDRPLPDGRYRVLLRGSGPALLTDWNGVPIDGDRDGAPGGDAIIEFTLGSAP